GFERAPRQGRLQHAGGSGPLADFFPARSARPRAVLGGLERFPQLTVAGRGLAAPLLEEGDLGGAGASLFFEAVELGLGLRLELVSPLQRARSEEHTSELQSRENLVCRLLLEKKKINTTI